VIEILKTADIIRLHYLSALLEEAGIQAAVFDAAGQWPGAFPARLMVPADDEDLARRLIVQAEREGF
jgi:hypothetical protein